MKSLPTFEIKPIATLHSPFKQKFGLPRQSGLINTCTATLELLPPYNTLDAVKGLSEFSHAWLIFKFHQNKEDTFRPLIRPPRLGGNKKIGVFASRSSYRPNGLGMSQVEILNITSPSNKVLIEISCPDILDKTPIFDIKPYIAYSDSVPEAISGFAQTPPTPSLLVNFNETCQLFIKENRQNYNHDLKALIIEVLSFDPRPAYKALEDNKIYTIRLFDMDITWTVTAGKVNVTKIEKLLD